MRRIQIVLWAIIITAFVVTLFSTPALIRFWPFTAGELTEMLAPLLIVGLIIERTLEVFLTSWRGPTAVQLEQNVRQIKAQMEKDPKVGFAAFASEEKKKIEYKSDTLRVAFLVSLTLGVLVSAIGVRLLEQLADPAIFQTLSSTQKAWIRGLDVLLTGALLGGGAEGIHKVVSVFTSFMDAATKKNKDK